MRIRSFTLVLTGLFALACGGTSVDTRPHLEAVCASAGPVSTSIAVPTLKLPMKTELEQGPLLSVTEGELLLDFEFVKPDGLAVRLKEKFEMQRVLRGKGAQNHLLLAVDGALPMTVVEPLLGVLRSAGVQKLGVLGYASTAPKTPPFPDPEYAATLGAKMQAEDPSTRQTMLAREMEDLLVACPGGQQVFAAVAHASAETKCKLMAVGMGEALPSCVLTDGDKVITLVQLLVGPSERGVLTSIDLQLSDDGEALPELGATWKDAMDALSPLDGKKISLGE